MTTITLAQKLARAFAWAFLGAFLPLLVNTLAEFAEHGDWAVWRVLLFSGIAGATAVAVRAVIAYLPVFEDDNQTGISKDADSSRNVGG